MYDYSFSNFVAIFYICIYIYIYIYVCTGANIYFCSTIPLIVSVEFSGDHKSATKMRYSPTTLSFMGITGFKIVVFVIYVYIYSVSIKSGHIGGCM